MSVSTVLRVRVTPRAPRNQIVRVQEGVVYLRVNAAPVDGAANRAVVELFADLLGVSRGAVSIAGGQTSRNKAVRVEGRSRAEIMSRLGLSLGESGANG